MARSCCQMTQICESINWSWSLLKRQTGSMFSAVSCMCPMVLCIPDDNLAILKSTGYLTWGKVSGGIWSKQRLALLVVDIRTVAYRLAGYPASIMTCYPVKSVSSSGATLEGMPLRTTALWLLPVMWRWWSFLMTFQVSPKKSPVLHDIVDTCYPCDSTPGSWNQSCLSKYRFYVVLCTNQREL